MLTQTFVDCGCASLLQNKMEISSNPNFSPNLQTQIPFLNKSTANPPYKAGKNNRCALICLVSCRLILWPPLTTISALLLFWLSASQVSPHLPPTSYIPVPPLWPSVTPHPPPKPHSPQGCSQRPTFCAFLPLPSSASLPLCARGQQRGTGEVEEKSERQESVKADRLYQGKNLSW